MHAYNVTTHSATGLSPFFLVVGRDPKLPVDFCFDYNCGRSEKYPGHWVPNHQERLQEAYNLANKRFDDAAASGKSWVTGKQRRPNWPLELDFPLETVIGEKQSPGRLARQCLQSD